MPDNQPTPLRPPLFISARLMAAIRVEGKGTIHVAPARPNRVGRVAWRYVIEDHGRHVLDEGTDLYSGAVGDVDPRRAMAALLGFLGAAAEAQRHTMNGQGSENASPFPPDVMEWAYEHDDELAGLALELEGDSEGEGEGAEATGASGGTTPAERNAIWGDVWARTECADCAGSAAQGYPWGPGYCWATHRPHRPPVSET